MGVKNEVLKAIVKELQLAIPPVTWTRKALYPAQVTNWPTGCVVAVEWRASGEVGAPRIWEGTIHVRVYAKADGTANEDMVELLDHIEETLDGADIDGAVSLQIMTAAIDQDELDTKQCQLDTTFSLTI